MIMPAAAIAVGLLAGCAGAGQNVSTVAPVRPNPAPNVAPTPSPSPLPQGDQPVTLNPADFTTKVDNPYFPLVPGTKRVYRETGTEGEQRSEVMITHNTKKIQGIDTVVVHDVVTEANGTLVEDTWDWYAQDKQGTVWYLGEAVKNYTDGELTNTEGSWEAGVDGAYAGVIMPAHSMAGQVYRQEYYKGHAEDSAKVLAVGEKVTVAYGSYANVLKTEDSTPLKPEREHRYYAPGVGLVQIITVAGGSDRSELVELTKQ
jgi:hypothetical protein